MMRKSNYQKQKILIVDDSELNRSILADILEDEYEIFEAADGVEAIAIIQNNLMELSAVLLDIVMPRMNGFEVLSVMNQRHWIEDLPVIIISAESGSGQIERAYNMGATDFIMRPFDAVLVH
jgi:putative two-component system response regulator